MRIAELADVFLTASVHTLRPNARLAYGYGWTSFSALPDIAISDIARHNRAFLHRPPTSHQQWRVGKRPLLRLGLLAMI